MRLGSAASRLASIRCAAVCVGRAVGPAVHTAEACSICFLFVSGRKPMIFGVVRSGSGNFGRVHQPLAGCVKNLERAHLSREPRLVRKPWSVAFLWDAYPTAVSTEIGLLLEFGAWRLEFKHKTRTCRLSIAPNGCQRILSCKFCLSCPMPQWRSRQAIETGWTGWTGCQNGGSRTDKSIRVSNPVW